MKKGIREHVFRALDPYDMALALERTVNAFLFRNLKDPAQFLEGDNMLTAADIFFRGVLSN